ncbi:ATP-dependent helicase [Geomonas nitrogeniifigens]|uniref:ATP-dependent helicase n=1 Tax=Geomonas diazotrophica TaxID=2843197 RepID=UPI001C2B9FDC|nr:ATP-dependent helicase [Geomonas nitrogeniifigens]QXE87358.1 ATP-dependent helicase [Geomonas nitrogeniifigens]
MNEVLVQLLDSRQRAAVRHRGSNLLILAGAGSGKTKTLVARALSMLDEPGDRPILFATFTRKAAQEIRERVRAACPDPDLGGRVWIGTFHSLCWKLLQQNGSGVNASGKWSILDSVDSDRIFSIAAKAYGVLNLKQIRAIQSLYSFSINAALPMEDLLASPSYKEIQGVPLPVTRKIVGKYESLCKRSGRIDFDNIQRLLLDTLNWDGMAAELRGKIHHIFVDEFQDTNNIQCNILKKLHNANLTAVGDDSQSIYGFRAANVNNIITFEAAFNAEKVVLENNYRSTAGIVDLANISIGNNRSQIFKTCRSQKVSPRKPRLIVAQTPAEEAHCIAQTVQNTIARAKGRPSLAVLSRTTRQAALLQNELTKRGIDYRLIGGKDFFAEDHIKILLDYLRLVQNPFDVISLLSINNLLRLAPQDHLDQLELRAERNDTDFWSEAIADRSVHRPGLLQFKETIDRYRAEYRKNQDIRTLLVRVARSIKRQLLERLPLSSDDLDQDIGIMLELAGQFREINKLLESFSLNAVVENREQVESQVVISTIHSAKGLEWDHVFVIGLVEYWFPLNLALSTPGGEEEERRLFYVAVTRASHDLYLSGYTSSSNSYGKAFSQEISRFVEELPGHVLDRFKAPPIGPS